MKPNKWTRMIVCSLAISAAALLGTTPLASAEPNEEQQEKEQQQKEDQQKEDQQKEDQQKEDQQKEDQQQEDEHQTESSPDEQPAQKSGQVPGQQASNALVACDHYMTAYARSAARKLARALSGQKYAFSQLPKQSSLQASTPDQTERQFEVFFENDRTSAGVVEKTRTHRTTYVITLSEIGAVVALHRWPSRKAVASGKEECKPLSSSIAYPAVPVAQIDVDPFKFWGLRVIWHIPTDLPDDSVETAPLDALRAAIQATK